MRFTCRAWKHLILLCTSIYVLPSACAAWRASGACAASVDTQPTRRRLSPKLQTEETPDLNRRALPIFAYPQIAAISAVVSDETGHRDHGISANGGGDDGAARDGEKCPSMLSVGNFSEALGSAIDSYEETETDTGSELEPSPSPRRLYGRREPPSPTAAAENGGRGIGKNDGRGIGKNDAGGSVTATAAGAAVGAGSTQSTEAMSPSSVASASSPPPRAPSSPSSVAAAVDSALGRVLHLRELLGSVGDAKAWSRLLGGDAHQGCRRLADLALSSSKAVLLPRKGAPTETAAAAEGGAVAPGQLDGPCRRLCSAALGCLAMCGRISPGVWADLSSADDSKHLDGGGGSRSGRGGEDRSSRLTQLLLLALSLAENNEAAAAATGLNEHEYFFGKGAGGGAAAGRRRRQGEREETGQEQEQEEEEGEEEPELSAMGLALIYEILTGERACVRVLVEQIFFSG